MPRTLVLSIVAATVGLAACTVSQTSQPPLTGPSGFATSLTVAASPDSISRDGSSQSAIVVTASDANGQPLAGLAVRVDMKVGGVAEDFGTLAARSLVTGKDGRATTVFTAPPAPPAGAGSSTTMVTIVATPLGSNAQASLNTASADIRLNPIGVIQPPDGSANTPTAAFTINPAAPVAAALVQFDASASCGGQVVSGACSGSHQIISYQWSYGDGDTAVGRTVSHTYRSAGSYTVSLVVSNELGLSNTKSSAVSVGNPSPAGGDWVFSPANPVIGDNVFFNANGLSTSTGHSLVQYAWDFGDGQSASGVQVTHVFTGVNTFTVVLTVTDDAGQKTAISHPVTVGSGNPEPSFILLPAVPAVSQDVTFDAGKTQVFGGATIQSYQWSFQGGNPSTSTNGPQVTVHFTGASPAEGFTVTLTVIDSLGRRGSTSQQVTVTP